MSFCESTHWEEMSDISPLAPLPVSDRPCGSIVPASGTCRCPSIPFPTDELLFSGCSSFNELLLAYFHNLKEIIVSMMFVYLLDALNTIFGTRIFPVHVSMCLHFETWT